ncbi:hypothetical protein ABZX92_22350 [Lentzea sp. NPDC006480]|uniref:hypothetical protein n=1 Tax=Lentzea sp. NPDC006480 TaxID=3157176 RepID=UPI0033A43584
MGDDFEDDWSTQTVSIKVDSDLATAVRLVGERLGIRLVENEYGQFRGPDASGATVTVFANDREIPDFLTDEQKASTRESNGPQPSSIYVPHTAVGREIVEALSGPPFRLSFLMPRATAADLRREAGWERVVAALNEQGWRKTWLRIDGPPVVLEGHVPTGEEYELQCRGDRCWFEVDVAGFGWKSYTLDYEGAGVIEPDDAVRVLHELHGRWLAGEPDDDGC